MKNITGFGQKGTNRSILGILIISAFVVSGFFAPNSALAAATVTPATNGTNVSIDTTSAGGTGTYKTLSGPGINELVAGDISIGVHTITLPAGWEFEISTINISTFGSDIVFESTNITPSATSFSFNVTTQSTTGGFVGFSDLKVRPTGTTPSIGNMTYSGASIVGVDGNTNFGTLSTVPGTVTRLAFTTEPGNAVYGSLLSSQPVVVTQDQFGNNSTNGLGANLDVTVAKTSGTGTLIGTATLDIGTGATTPGTVTFTNLTVNEFGAGKQLTASATGLTDAVSDDFEITKKPLTATITVVPKDYDGNDSATIDAVALVGIMEWDESADDVSADIVTIPAVATFDDINAGTQDISVNGVTLAGADKNNYTLDNNDITGTGTINPLGVTITPTAGQTKVYGNNDPIEFTFANFPALISPDDFTGVLDRTEGEDVGTYAFTLGTLEDGLDNYALILAPETFAITQRTLVVTATGINKVYDGNTTATVTLSDDRVDGDVLTLDYTATFNNEDVGTDKSVSVIGITITGGTDAGNYTLNGVTTDDTTADITAKPLAASFTTDANKTYNGSATAAITGRSLEGIVEPDVVDVTGGSATFADKHIGNDKVVTATGFTLTGADSGNYSIGTINTTTGNVNPRLITVTAVTDTKTYDGATSSDDTPTITSSFSPPIAVGDVASFIQTYDTKHFGIGKVLTPSGVVIDGNPILEGSNYTVTFTTVSTGEITKKSINVTAQPDTKTYDGATSSDEAPVVGALETGDTVGTAPTQSYDTEDKGTGKTLTPSGLVINDGNDGANYTIVSVTNTDGVINAKELTVTGAVSVSRIYNGDIDAEVNFTSAELVGVVGEEDVDLNSDNYFATYDNKNVGTGKTVTVSGLELDGDGANNYSLTQPVLNEGVITVRTLVVNAITPSFSTGWVSE